MSGGRTTSRPRTGEQGSLTRAWLTFETAFRKEAENLVNLDGHWNKGSGKTPWWKAVFWETKAMCKQLSLALMTPQGVGGVGCEVGEMDSGLICFQSQCQVTVGFTSGQYMIRFSS